MSDKIHERGYWLTGDASLHWFDASLAAELATLFAGATVLDLGCGRGEYVRSLNARGIDALGVDGNPHTHDDCPDCWVADLSRPLAIGRRDWVLSLEVGEHIPRKFEAAYIENVTKHALRGVVLSWAVPGQCGHGHVNERHNECVRSRLGKRGFESDLATEARLRGAASLRWFKNSLMVFRR